MVIPIGMRTIIIVLLCLLAACSGPEEAKPQSGSSKEKSLWPFVGDNCDLTEPPVDSGDDLASNKVYKIYPRLSAMSASYTGCQIMWMPKSVQGGWRLLFLSYYEQGEPTRFLAYVDVFKEGDVCLYEKGGRRAVAGPSGECPPISGVRHKSYPPGCAERILQDEQKPEECVYD